MSIKHKIFFRNITYLGFRYFKLKSKPGQFSQRALMRALGYSESGASYISWRKGVVPGKEKLQQLADKISRLILDKENISITVTSEILLNDSLEAFVEIFQKNELANIMAGLESCELSEKEKMLIALLRLLENKPEHSDLIDILETTIKLLSLQIDDNLPESEKHTSLFETIRTLLLQWIKPTIKI